MAKEESDYDRRERDEVWIVVFDARGRPAVEKRYELHAIKYMLRLCRLTSTVPGVLP